MPKIVTPTVREMPSNSLCTEIGYGMIIQYGDVVDPITFRAADGSEPLGSRSPSNVARPSSPMIVASPASLRFAQHASN